VKLQINENEYLFEMANIRGKSVKVPHKLPFSFYFSSKDCVEGKSLFHGIRVKPVLNSENVSISMAGDLKLCDDWEFIPPDGEKVDSKLKKQIIEFFRTYKILFAAVWEKVLPPDALYDYFRGTIDFQELKEEFDFYDEFSNELNDIHDLNCLTDFIRTNNLFNLWES